MRQQNNGKLSDAKVTIKLDINTGLSMTQCDYCVINCQLVTKIGEIGL